MTNEQIIMIIFGMFAVTFPVRFIPLISTNRIQIPKIVKIWLGYVPLALFAGLLTQIVVGGSIESFELTARLPLILSIIFTIGVTIKTKSIGWGMSVGFICFIILQLTFA